MPRQTKQQKTTKASGRAKTQRPKSAPAVAEENGALIEHDGLEPDHQPRPGPVGQALYWVSYQLSFGVVFPILLVARLVPKENPIVYGLVDGAMAARDSVFGSAEHALESSEHGSHALEAQHA
jgi:hypothetical protein